MDQRLTKQLTIRIVIYLATIFTKLQFDVSAAADSISYIGAVAEYHPVTNGTNGIMISNENAKNYVTIIKSARKFNADIVVFPEDSLTAGLNHSDTDRSEYPFYSSVIPEAGTDSPCDNSSSVVIEALRLISCAAKNNSIYVVVNLHEMVNCKTQKTTSTTKINCPTDNHFYYNTNVVFNRTGGIISKYRKYNLFNEPGINVTYEAENSTFYTDFNVTFGHIICFDIYFKKPALTLVRNYNITDIIHPARWFSELPYLTSIQTQSSWSFENNVNLLSSGYNNPKTGNGGSGIYAGYQGNLINLWTENIKNSILVARIPKLIEGGRKFIKPDKNYPLIYNFTNDEIPTLFNDTSISEKILFQDNLKFYKTLLLPDNKNGRNLNRLKLCDKKFCCQFIIDITLGNNNSEFIDYDSVYYRHRIAIFNGVRSFAGSVTAGVQICGLISCTNEKLSSCGLRYSNNIKIIPTLFNDIKISGNFLKGYNNTLEMPNSLISNTMLPLNSSQFYFNKNIIFHHLYDIIEYNLTNKVYDLISFTIYRRNFTNDGKNHINDYLYSSYEIFNPFKFLLIVTTTVAIFFNI